MTVTNPDFPPLSFTAQRLPPVDLIGEPARQEHVVQGVQDYLRITTTGIHVAELESQVSSLKQRAQGMQSYSNPKFEVAPCIDGLLVLRHICQSRHSYGTPRRGATGVRSTSGLTTCMCMWPHTPLPATACYRHTSLPRPHLILSLICPPALSQQSAPTTHPTPAPLKQTSASVHN